MAFALALNASELYGDHGRVMKTCTLYLITITVLFNGGLSAMLLKKLGLRAEDSGQSDQVRGMLLKLGTLLHYM